MPKVTYVEHDGVTHTVDLAVGLTVMEGAIKNNISGIQGECGGSMACATCHVYVDEQWLGRLIERSSEEEDMLECAAAPCKQNSRLGCQLTISDELDGLLVHLPETQY